MHHLDDVLISRVPDPRSTSERYPGVVPAIFAASARFSPSSSRKDRMLPPALFVAVVPMGKNLPEFPTGMWKNAAFCAELLPIWGSLVVLAL